MSKIEVIKLSIPSIDYSDSETENLEITINNLEKKIKNFLNIYSSNVQQTGGSINKNIKKINSKHSSHFFQNLKNNTETESEIYNISEDI